MGIVWSKSWFGFKKGQSDCVVSVIWAVRDLVYVNVSVCVWVWVCGDHCPVYLSILHLYQGHHPTLKGPHNAHKCAHTQTLRLIQTHQSHTRKMHIYIYASIYMWASVGHLSSWNPPRAARTGSSLVIWEVTAAKTHSKQNYSCLFLKKAYISHSQTNFIQSPDPPGLSINPQPWSAHFCPMLRQSKAWPVSVLLGLALALHKPGAPSSLGLPSVSPIALISTCMDKLSS